MGVSVERLKNYVNYFMNGHLIAHFEKEERLLFDLVDAPVCLQAKKEHAVLMDHIQTINHSPLINPNIFIELIDMLNKHIRFEERVVFPTLEKLLDEQTLSSIQDELEIDDHTFKDEYPDEFWVPTTV